VNCLPVPSGEGEYQLLFEKWLRLIYVLLAYQEIIRKKVAENSIVVIPSNEPLT
jgi:hypothetical protein